MHVLRIRSTREQVTRPLVSCLLKCYVWLAFGYILLAFEMAMAGQSRRDDFI